MPELQVVVGYHCQPCTYDMHKFAYYMCFTCCSPYFAGHRSCEVRAGQGEQVCVVCACVCVCVSVCVCVCARVCAARCRLARANKVCVWVHMCVRVVCGCV